MKNNTIKEIATELNKAEKIVIFPHYKKQGFFLTTRYSPGYGDLPIGIQRNFIRLLDTVRRIGLNVSDSGIMIPRKSVTAIIGISEAEKKQEKLGCKGCNLVKTCRFLRRGMTCGR